MAHMRQFREPLLLPSPMIGPETEKGIDQIGCSECSAGESNQKPLPLNGQTVPHIDLLEGPRPVGHTEKLIYRCSLRRP
jgi:hypothetical protein